MNLFVCVMLTDVSLNLTSQELSREEDFVYVEFYAG